MRIVVASEARDDLAEAAGYIAKDNPTAAARRLHPNRSRRPHRSSQSRVAKMEAGDPSVSVDLLIRTLLALGVNRKQVGRAIGAAISA